MDEDLKELLERAIPAAEDCERTLDTDVLEQYLSELREAHTSLLSEEEEDMLLSVIAFIESKLNELED